VGVISTALRRRDTYVGHVREALGFARAVAAYPRGMFESAITCGNPCGDIRHDTPVLLVHGFGHNRSAWMVLERHLRKAGFTSVHTFNYNPLIHDVPEIARRLKDRVDLLRAVTGAPRVHLVGHSLGGIVIRWFVQELGGASVVDTAVSVASPHHGTVAALGMAASPFGRTAKQLLPGSPVMRRLASKPLAEGVRWVAYYTNLDLLVQPGSSGKLDGAENILVKDHGHLSILLSLAVARSISEQLEASEGVGAAALAA
jgi:triacylglycerol lipase